MSRKHGLGCIFFLTKYDFMILRKGDMDPALLFEEKEQRNISL
jgi:hypothetical protein